MALIKTVAILCMIKIVQCQYYEADYESFQHGSNDDGANTGPIVTITHTHSSEGGDDSNGFVTPLDFYPLFGLHASETKPTTQVFTIYHNNQKQQISPTPDYYLGLAPNDEQFSPENFGFYPKYSQGLASETEVKPKVYREKTVVIERSSPAIQKTSSLSGESAPYKGYSYQSSSAGAPIESLAANTHLTGYPLQQLHSLTTKLHRNKRYTNKKRKQKKKARNDDYGYLSEYRSRPREFDDEVYDAPDFSFFGDNAKLKEYDYGSDVEYGLDEYEKIKSVSEKEAAEASKDPANCVEVKKESMTCRVCTNPKTGGNYESCSYKSEPTNNKYAYVKEHKFDSKDDPKENGTASEETKETPQKAENNEEAPSSPQAAPLVVAPAEAAVDIKPRRGSARYQQDFINIKPQQAASTPQKYQRYYTKPQDNPITSSTSDQPTKYHPSKYVRSATKYGQASKYAEPAKRKQPAKYVQAAKYTQLPKYEPQPSQPEKYTAYSDNNEDEEGDDDDEEDEDDEDDDEEGDDDEEEDDADDDENKGYNYRAAIPDFFSDNEPKKNVEHVLAEFVRKDRSACNKSFKKGMTCYECVGKTGLKHEECMFVSESAPVSSHLAYKELKEFNTKPNGTSIIPAAGNEGAESKVVSNSNPAPSTEPTTTTTTTSTTTTTTTPLPIHLKKRQPFKKYNPDDPNEPKKLSAVFSENSTNQPIKRHVKRSAPPKRKAPLKQGIEKEALKQSAELKEKTPSGLSQLDDIANPAEFVEESKGAFWEETVPKYSKELGLSLPKYMLARSEHEEFFDDFLGRG